MPNVQDLDPAFGAALQKLLAASRGKITVNSGYRDSALQAKLYAQALQKYGSEQEARRWVAPPGHSKHEQGLAADLGGDMGLAHKLAGQFGLTFPLSNENWHIEPLGARGNTMATTQTRQKQNPYLAGIPPANALIAALGQIPGFGSSLSPVQNAPVPPQPTAPGLPLPGYYNPQSDLAEMNRLAPLAVPPGPMQQELASLPIQQARQNRLLDLMQQNVPYVVPFVPTDLPPPVAREQLPIPQAEAPRQDAMGSILGAIAGFVDPIGAGRYNAAPLEAATHVADQNYADNLRRWQMASQQANQRYDDAQAGREEAIRNATFNHLHQYDADVANRDAQNRYYQQLDPVAAESAGLTKAGEILPGLASGEQTTQEAAAKLAALKYGIDRQEAANGPLARYYQTLSTTAMKGAELAQKTSQQAANLTERSRHNQATEGEANRYHDLLNSMGLKRIDAMGNLRTNAGKALTPYQVAALQLRAATMGITLPTNMIGGEGNVIPGLPGVIDSNKNKPLAKAAAVQAKEAFQQFQATQGAVNRQEASLNKAARAQGILDPGAIARFIHADPTWNQLAATNSTAYKNYQDAQTRANVKTPASPAVSAPNAPKAPQPKTGKVLIFDPATNQFR